MKFQYYKLTSQNKDFLDNAVLHCSKELAQAYAKAWNECKDYYALSEEVKVEKLTSTKSSTKILEPDEIKIAIKRLYSEAISIIDKGVAALVDKKVDDCLGKKLLFEIEDYISSKNHML